MKDNDILAKAIHSVAMGKKLTKKQYVQFMDFADKEIEEWRKFKKMINEIYAKDYNDEGSTGKR